MLDTGLKFYAYYLDPHQWPCGQGHGLCNFMFKFTCILFCSDKFTPLSATISIHFPLWLLFFGTDYQLISSRFQILTPLNQESLRSVTPFHKRAYCFYSDFKLFLLTLTLSSFFHLAFKLFILHYFTFSSLTNTPGTSNPNNTQKRIMDHEKIDRRMIKFLEVYIFWSFCWILLILCLILDTGLKFYSVPSPCPPPITDIEVKVTDIEFFCYMKCLYHISQSSESIHISNRVCFHFITTDPRVHAMGWG